MVNQKQSASGWLAHIRRFFTDFLGDTSFPDIEYSKIYQHLVEASPSGMILVDAQQPDFPIICVNEAFVKSTGYTANEVQGKNCRFLQGTDREQPERKIIRQALKHKRPCTVTLRNYRKDGSMFWNELRIAPIRSEQGIVTHFIGIQNDVTERKQIEQALQQSEKRYRQMFENNRAIQLLIDPETGRIIQANQAAANFYGYDTETLASMRISDINTLSEAEVHAEMRYAVTQERTFFEFQHRLASGEIRDVHVFSSPIDTMDGQILYSIVVDVDEEQKTQRLYESLFQQSNDAVFMLTMEGRHAAVNQRAVEMLGYTTEEIIGLSYKDLVVPEEHHLSDSVLERMLAGETILPYERTFRRKDGVHIPTEINVEIVRDTDGTPMYLQSIVRDISERKQMENTLRENEARLRAMIEAIPDTIFRNRIDGTYLDWHAPDESLLIEKPENFLGNKIQDTLPEPIATEQMAAIQRAIATGHVATHEFSIPLTNGERHFEVRIVPAADDEVVSIARDVTDIRQAQQKELELVLEKERLRLLTTFIQDAAHEFRTPLSTIGTTAYLMARSDDPDRRGQKQRRIEDQIQKITNLVDVLTLMVKLENPETLSLLPTDFRAIVQFVCREIFKEDEESPKMDCKLTEDIPTILGDVIHLTNAVQQLLDNAFRFTPKDGTVTVTMGYTETTAWLQIQDTGIGIAEEDLPNIFETFWRKDKAHTTHGFGLGLPIAQKIIQHHGGDIFIESAPGVGTTIRATIPLLNESDATNTSAIDA